MCVCVCVCLCVCVCERERVHPGGLVSILRASEDHCARETETRVD